MKAGAVDYLPKPFRDEDFLCAVERALKRSSEQWLQRSQRKEVRDRLATLTPREFDVLKCVIAGRLNKHIASHPRHNRGDDQGSIAGRVMEKMGATSSGGAGDLGPEGRDRHRRRPDATKVYYPTLRSERVAL